MSSYEDYDYAAIEEAEAILNGTIPSTPETYKLVEQWYGKPAQGISSDIRGRDTGRIRTKARELVTA